MMNPMLIIWFAATLSITSDPGNGAQPLQACLSSLTVRPFSDEPCLAVLTEPADEQFTRSADPALSPREKARVHATLAAGYASIGMLVEADQQIAQALRLAADDWHTLANSGVVHLRNNRFAEAQRDLTDAMLANPDFPPFLLLNRSLAFRGQGRFIESAQDVDEYNYLLGLAPISTPCVTGDSDCRPSPDVAPRRGG